MGSLQPMAISRTATAKHSCYNTRGWLNCASPDYQAAETSWKTARQLAPQNANYD
jgi:hypothetical protein